VVSPDDGVVRQLARGLLVDHLLVERAHREEDSVLRVDLGPRKQLLVLRVVHLDVSRNY
jgi:hypothetical protein